ncbi:putative hydrolase or acyltransferase of alpha/beta superfamily [Mycobacterium sp. JS623]|uniref:alpha/beta fold hydrolase n=1 Tax=Mycobacterium sp. JS623 TaxID=212767 RepID=UPI0002A5B308|nr:alpha/beta fold hydrolase [Mycobacterium sp. JS623]AGB25596.1 putative hydrolase or acyltransferase of alpha/beta superfamily [Mycobacterium sp. JS623]
MTTLLFVHSPVAGPSTWIYAAEVLQQNGFGCVVPDLTGVATTGPPYYPKYAKAAAAAVDGGVDPVVLVGHSAGGALLPAIAEAVGERTTGAVFVDAMLPQPGRSWFDTAPPGLEAQLRGLAVHGVLPPYHEWFSPGALADWVPDAARRGRLIAEIPRMPLAYFDEPAPRSRFAEPVSRAFVRLGAPFDAAADKAQRLGWWVARRDWDHLRMLSDPEAVAEVIALAISANDSG